jgi:hypothetical protein
VVRQMTQGLKLGGVVLLAGVAAMLAGCSSLGAADQTAAIAAPAVNESQGAAVGAVAGDTMAQAGAVGKAITLADATCDQIKAEIATFEADKIPSKLADFGKAKYHPTSEESIRFARYVDVEKAGKDKNCAPAAMKKKQITASKTPATVDPMAAKKAVAAKPAAKLVPQAQAKAAAPVVPKVAKAAAKVVAPDAALTVPMEDGVTVTVPDSSG